MQSSWTITSGAGTCVIAEGETQSCVQDASGDYGNNEDCSFEYSGHATAVTISRAEWGVEAHGCQYDWLEVDGQKYCGGANAETAFPLNFEAPAGVATLFTWSSDLSFTDIGFKLCAPPRVSRVKCNYY